MAEGQDISFSLRGYFYPKLRNEKGPGRNQGRLSLSTLSHTVFMQPVTPDRILMHSIGYQSIDCLIRLQDNQEGKQEG